MMSASVFSSFDDSVHELQLVSWVAVWELCVANALCGKHKFHSLGIHSLSSKHCPAWDQLAEEITCLVKKNGREVSVLEVFHCFGRDTLYKFDCRVLPGEHIKAFIQDTALHNAKIRWLDSCDSYSLTVLGRDGLLLLPL